MPKKHEYKGGLPIGPDGRKDSIEITTAMLLDNNLQTLEHIDILNLINLETAYRIPMPVSIKNGQILEQPIFTPFHAIYQSRTGCTMHMMKIYRLEQGLIFFPSFPYFVTQPFFLISSQNSWTRSLRQIIFSIIVKLYEEAVKDAQTRGVLILADTKFEFGLRVVSSYSSTSTNSSHLTRPDSST